MAVRFESLVDSLIAEFFYPVVTLRAESIFAIRYKLNLLIFVSDIFTVSRREQFLTVAQRKNGAACLENS